MNIKFFITIFLLAIVSFSSCNVGKVLDKPAYILVDNSKFSTNFETMSEKYVDRQMSDEYMIVFESKLEESLESYNIEVVNSLDQSFETENIFALELSNLLIDEKYETQSVYMDSLSQYPETFDVVTCSVDAECTLYKIKSDGTETRLRTITVNADLEEKLTNNRTFWQLIFGSNKDNSEYTYKELNDDVINSLCSKSARRIAGKSSRTIAKSQE